jgi:hypothetical protein
MPSKTGPDERSQALIFSPSCVETAHRSPLPSSGGEDPAGGNLIACLRPRPPSARHLSAHHPVRTVPPGVVQEPHRTEQVFRAPPLCGAQFLSYLRWRMNMFAPSLESTSSADACVMRLTARTATQIRMERVMAPPFDTKVCACRQHTPKRPLPPSGNPIETNRD